VILNGSRLLNLDDLPGLAAGSAETFDLLDDVQALDDFAENDVFAIEPARHDLYSLACHPCRTAEPQNRRPVGRVSCGWQWVGGGGEGGVQW
jgi:hypothetical protein